MPSRLSRQKAARTSGITVNTTPENNLGVKALSLLRTRYGIPPVEIHLLKKIPFGAGIGGGSADASFMLKMLNDMFLLGIEEPELAGFAKQLGADCPFFVYNRPMFASGIGEQLEDIPLSLENYYMALVKPGIHIPTRDAFASIIPAPPRVSLKDIIKLPVEQWKGLIFNDFEKSIFAKYPLIEEIKEKLYSLGAVYASMSGSGSSVYGIFEHETSLRSVFEDCFVWESKKQ